MALVVLAITGCSDASGPVGDGTGGTDGQGSTTTGGTDGQGSTTTMGDDSNDGVDSLSDTLGDDTGSVEDGAADASTFGMGDDMPLLTSIPSIKQGLIAVDTFVLIRGVLPTSSLASFDDERWFYGEDVSVEEFRGLRVMTVDDPPDFGRMQDLIGYVGRSEEGWSLDLDRVIPGADHDGATPRVLTVGDLLVSEASNLDDALVELTAEGSLELAEEGELPGTWVVRDDAAGETVLIDLRPFGVEGLPLVPGARLQQMVGIAEIGADSVVILPRGADDIVLAG